MDLVILIQEIIMCYIVEIMIELGLKCRRKSLYLNKIKCQFKVPFMLYADFESLLVPVDSGTRKNQSAPHNPKLCFTRGVNVHEPSGWCVYSTIAYGKVENPTKQYRGKNCVSKFCEHIILEAKRLRNSFLELPMIPPTSKQRELHESAKICHICTNKVTEKDVKVRDHCHYTGQCRGPARMSCNLKYKIPSYIPVVQ